MNISSLRKHIAVIARERSDRGNHDLRKPCEQKMIVIAEVLAPLRKDILVIARERSDRGNHDLRKQSKQKILVDAITPALSKHHPE